MNKGSGLFRTSFRGYDKKQVENHIYNMNLEQENNIKGIENDISNILNKNKELSIEIENIKNQLSESCKSQDYMDFLLGRVDNMERLMWSGAKSEIRELKEECKEKGLYIEDEIQKLNRFFKNVQCNFDILLKTVAVKSHSSEAVNGFKVIQYKGKNCSKMLQNDTEKEANKMVVNETQLKEPQDYDDLRNVYILGKFAGEDLISKTGEIIVHKNAVITEEIVQEAEDAGKLSELIINMTIPEL